MESRSNTLWTFAITSVALFMTTLDNLVVTTADRKSTRLNSSHSSPSRMPSSA